MYGPAPSTTQLSAHQFLVRVVKGFKLIELMVTIAIGTILLVVAVPSFVAFQRNALLPNPASNFIAALNLARANAMKQGVDTYVVPKTGSDWSSGWNVYADTNWNHSYDVGADPIISGFDAPSSSVFVGTGNNSFLAGYVRFNGSGYPRLLNNAPVPSSIVMSNGTRSSTNIVDIVGRVMSCTTGTVGCVVIP